MNVNVLRKVQAANRITVTEPSDTREIGTDTELFHNLSGPYRVVYVRNSKGKWQKELGDGPPVGYPNSDLDMGFILVSHSYGSKFQYE